MFYIKYTYVYIYYSDFGSQGRTPSNHFFFNFPHNRNFVYYVSLYHIVLNPYNSPSKYYYIYFIHGKVKYSKGMCFTQNSRGSQRARSEIQV